jgi:hypothetical protein
VFFPSAAYAKEKKKKKERRVVLHVAYDIHMITGDSGKKRESDDGWRNLQGIVQSPPSPLLLPFFLFQSLSLSMTTTKVADLQRCGLWSTTANLAKVALGSGILGLPAAVAAGKNHTDLRPPSTFPFNVEMSMTHTSQRTRERER